MYNCDSAHANESHGCTKLLAISTRIVDGDWWQLPDFQLLLQQQDECFKRLRG